MPSTECMAVALDGDYTAKLDTKKLIWKGSNGVFSTA